MVRLMFFLITVILVNGSVYARSCHAAGGGSPFGASGKHDHSNEQNVEARQTICPIMRKPVSPMYYADWEGNDRYAPKRVYFCCPPCIHRFNRNPRRVVRMLKRMNQPIEIISVETEDEAEDLLGE